MNEPSDGLPLFQVDAFTSSPFAGNPAAVCLLDRPREAEWMQALAAEMNLSETAFALLRQPRQSGQQPQDSQSGWDLRWFTPAVEVDLCGHATLATAHVLYSEGLLAPEEPARFHTRSGLLTVTRRGAVLEMDFPADPPRELDEKTEDRLPEDLARALGTRPVWTGRGRDDLLALLGSEQEVRALKPDMSLLKGLEARGVIVTASGGSGSDFVSRFFAPAAGIDEDPVTGSAHCTLCSFWAPRLGRDSLSARQVSPRGGELRVALKGDRVLLLGNAVTVFRGRLLV
ncbi:MAG: PhzF family phenazine biosynthesis protein [Deltaproteobacteria bacterium]|nr:PhzF family phenazine biosynthesis protein [Deltaproteobacteria bacterium]